MENYSVIKNYVVKASLMIRKNIPNIASYKKDGRTVSTITLIW